MGEGGREPLADVPVGVLGGLLGDVGDELALGRGLLRVGLLPVGGGQGRQLCQ